MAYPHLYPHKGRWGLAKTNRTGKNSASHKVRPLGDLRGTPAYKEGGGTVLALTTTTMDTQTGFDLDLDLRAEDDDFGMDASDDESDEDGDDGEEDAF